MKRLILLAIALSAVATACTSGEGLVTATPIPVGGTGADDGRNIAGELWDPLTNGKTVGTTFGNTTFIPGKGIQLNDITSFVRYQPVFALTTGEFSMEVEGLKPNGPAGKPKVFQISDLADANVTTRTSMINAQYRGSPGNPDNCIAFKAVLGSSSAVAEPDLALRNQSVFNLDPAQTYFWQGIWTTTTFQLIVKQGGVNGTPIYDRTLTAPGGTGFAASEMFAFLGNNDAKFGVDAGTPAGMIVRNVWLSNKPRP